MHILLGILGTVVTILILVKRLSDSGVDLGWLNPFSWYRRRQWRQKVSANPLFSLDNPMEAAAGLLYTAAKCSGDITREHKDSLLNMFVKEFDLTERDAVELLSSCSFLIKDEDDVANNVNKFLGASIEQFSEQQLATTVQLLNTIIEIEGKPSDKQQKLLADVGKFIASRTKKGEWH